MPAKTSILLIEDHAPLRENMTETLQLAGYQVASAADGKTGIQMAIGQKPELILCDIMLPHSNGYQVFSTIRQNPGTSHIPFIFMTGNMNITEHPLASGNYLPKPFTDRDLLDTIKKKVGENPIKKIEQEKMEHIEALEYILSSISHELRNPICSSIGLASLLEFNTSKGNNPEEIMRIVEGIKANAARLNIITCTLTDVVYQAIQNYKNKII